MAQAYSAYTLFPRVLAALFLAAWAFCGFGCGRAPEADKTVAAPTLPTFCEKPLGRENAAVQIQAFLPVNNGCQDPLGLYLVRLAQNYPDVFRVEVLDMKSERGHAIMVQNGIRCAAVRINGRTSFDLPQPTGKILLEGPMDPVDVYQALRQTLDAEGIALADDLPKPVIPKGFKKLRDRRHTPDAPLNTGGEK
ncbi:MAG: hypothetical protein KAI66_10410 [Lentisphaeria bacterium]|nr:hypothetical protein [Lentisphaeria bacterium]